MCSVQYYKVAGGNLAHFPLDYQALLEINKNLWFFSNRFKFKDTKRLVKDRIKACD